MQKFIAYYRVSTQKQGRSGLGLEAQKSCVRQTAQGGKIIAEFQEVESGNNNNRPELHKAIEAAKAQDATLIIAKLDRLARNASFILSLKEANVDFVACDIPQANTLTIGIMALLAQQERELISERTKAALAAKKRQGCELGTPANLTYKAKLKGAARRKEIARENPNNRKAFAYISSLRRSGKSYNEISGELNEAGFVSSRGNVFSAKTAQVIFLRYSNEGNINNGFRKGQ